MKNILHNISRRHFFEFDIKSASHHGY